MNWNEAARRGLIAEWDLEHHHVREYENRLAISRNDGNRLTWEEVQAVKNQVWGKRILAIELYPDQDKVVNLRHTRHIWRLREGALEWAVRDACTHLEFVEALRRANGGREGTASEIGGPGSLRASTTC